MNEKSYSANSSIPDRVFFDSLIVKKTNGQTMGGPGNSSTPANPNTNIEGAVLGYFSAHTFEKKQVVIE